MKLKTHITGNINGGAFECIGEGELHDGRSNSTLTFNNELVRYTPMYGKSWKCKNHMTDSILVNRPGQINPLSEFLDKGGKILSHTIIRYPYENSIILATSILDRPVADEQHLYQTRVGTFNGPTDILEERPFVEHIIPTGRGRALSYSVRQVVRENGEIIEITYQDELSFSDNFTLPFSLSIAIGGKEHYDLTQKKYTIDATVKITAST